MAQQEVAELRGQRAPADSEEGYAEHSEGSLPGDLSVMHHHHLQQQQQHSGQQHSGQQHSQHLQQQQQHSQH